MKIVENPDGTFSIISEIDGTELYAGIPDRQTAQWIIESNDGSSASKPWSDTRDDPPPGWEGYTASQYRTAIRNAYQDGAITAAQFSGALKDNLGYGDQAIAAELRDYAPSPTDTGSGTIIPPSFEGSAGPGFVEGTGQLDPKLTPAQIANGVKQKLWDAAQAYNALITNEGYTPQGAVDYLKQQKVLSPNATVPGEASFPGGSTDLEGAVAGVAAQGGITGLTPAAGEGPARQYPKTPVSTLANWAVEGRITPEQFQSELAVMGYTEFEIQQAVTDVLKAQEEAIPADVIDFRTPAQKYEDAFSGVGSEFGRTAPGIEQAPYASAQPIDYGSHVPGGPQQLIVNTGMSGQGMTGQALPQNRSIDMGDYNMALGTTGFDLTNSVVDIAGLDARNAAEEAAITMAFKNYSDARKAQGYTAIQAYNEFLGTFDNLDSYKEQFDVNTGERKQPTSNFGTGVPLQLDKGGKVLIPEHAYVVGESGKVYAEAAEAGDKEYVTELDNGALRFTPTDYDITMERDLPGFQYGGLAYTAPQTERQLDQQIRQQYGGLISGSTLSAIREQYGDAGVAAIYGSAGGTNGSGPREGYGASDMVSGTLASDAGVSYASSGGGGTYSNTSGGSGAGITPEQQAYIDAQRDYLDLQRQQSQAYLNDYNSYLDAQREYANLRTDLLAQQQTDYQTYLDAQRGFYDTQSGLLEQQRADYEQYAGAQEDFYNQQLANRQGIADAQNDIPANEESAARQRAQDTFAYRYDRAGMPQPEEIYRPTEGEAPELTATGVRYREESPGDFATRKANMQESVSAAELQLEQLGYNRSQMERALTIDAEQISLNLQQLGWQEAQADRAAIEEGAQISLQLQKYGFDEEQANRQAAAELARIDVANASLDAQEAARAATASASGGSRSSGSSGGTGSGGQSLVGRTFYAETGPYEEVSFAPNGATQYNLPGSQGNVTRQWGENILDARGIPYSDDTSTEEILRRVSESNKYYGITSTYEAA